VFGGGGGGGGGESNLKPVIRPLNHLTYANKILTCVTLFLRIVFCLNELLIKIFKH